ncbi:MAG: tRNA pseudouridine55 synthase [Actinomycetota bacterium]|jgi:tRNA pseudouridine55 synthase|nr:tRNA pseudouridine55 synthase [Actinomycetota bacterium]
MDGLLIVDKPAGVTSHDVVDQVRRRLGTRKVGHGGTLDPDATGVLVLGVGRATRFLSYSQASPKRYEALVKLGTTTSTQDASGDVIETRPIEAERSEVETALKRFEGDIRQIPPMVSAVRVGGERLYEKARRGEEVERKPRDVTIYAIALTDFSSDDGTLALDVRCSAGTYIRTIAHDLGQELGCGAHLARLRRTEAGGWTLADAVPLDDVTEEALKPLTEVARDMKRVDVNEDTARLVRNGRPILVDQPLERDELAAIVSGDDFLGVYKKGAEQLHPERVVSS